MAQIKLIRADFRLIHGQVITKWLHQSGASKIVIIDDMLAQDEFLASIYVMAAPPGTEVSVYAINDAVQGWKENQLGSGNLFILFKDVPTIYKSWKNGFPIEELQIGGLGASPGRVNVFGPITLNSSDAKMLKEISDAGSHIYLHQVPDEPSMEFSRVLEKNNFDLS